MQPSGLRDFGWLAVVGRDESYVVQGLQDQPGGWPDGPVIEGVEAGYVSLVVLGEPEADFAFDEAEDEQGQADHGDQGGDPAVGLQEYRCDGKGSMDAMVLGWCSSAERELVQPARVKAVCSPASS